MTSASRVLGVTGLPCSGKSYCAAAIAAGRVDGVAGVLIKADDIGHQVLERPNIRPLLVRELGEAVAAAPTPTARRAAIAARVFADQAKLAWLESLVHPLVNAEVLRVVESCPDRVVVEAALLLEAGLDALCDLVVLVEASREARLRRAARRGWSEHELARREQRLLPLFSEQRLGPLQNKLVRLDNSADDGFPPFPIGLEA